MNGTERSLEQLLGREDQFFDLLGTSAAQARASVQALIQLSKDPSKPDGMEGIHEARRRCKTISNQLSEALCTTFVMAAEHEDLSDLANCLYKIPKTVEKIGERILLAPHYLEGVDLTPQIAMVDKTTDTLIRMLQDLRRGARLDQIKRHNEQLQTIEGDADKMVTELLRGLYAGKMEGSRVVFLKDLYELLEKGTDRCRDAGNVIIRIALKNS